SPHTCPGWTYRRWATRWGSASPPVGVELALYAAQVPAAADVAGPDVAAGLGSARPGEQGLAVRGCGPTARRADQLLGGRRHQRAVAAFCSFLNARTWSSESWSTTSATLRCE